MEILTLKQPEGLSLAEAPPSICWSRYLSQIQGCDSEVGQIMSAKIQTLMSKIWTNNIYFSKIT